MLQYVYREAEQSEHNRETMRGLRTTYRARIVEHSSLRLQVTPCTLRARQAEHPYFFAIGDRLSPASRTYINFARRTPKIG